MTLRKKVTDNVVRLQNVEFYKQVATSKRKLSQTILRHPETTKSDAIVGDYIVSRYNPEKGYAWPPLDKMVEVLKLSKNTIIKATRHLEDLGFFTIRRPNRPGRGLCNEYVPNFQEIHPGKQVRWMNPSDSEKGSENGQKRVQGEAEKGFSPLHSIVDSKEEPSSSFLSTEKEHTKLPPAKAGGAGFARKPSPEEGAGRGGSEARVSPKGGRSAWSQIPIPWLVSNKVSPLGRISSWTEFDTKVLKQEKILYAFYTPENISPRYFRVSVDRFREIIINKRNVKWLDIDDACKALIHWIGKEEVRGGSERGKPWEGEDYE